ncbi:hypothetical protein [Pedobacter duraquae]|uniref:Uncharacterized protein n=1 Tax=Pedobacter duraquae TaxID=425511 RepID=A0A4R6IIX1_9SPHI|nr:hypothetical protein [Pedobacter duraquae]TDO21876.1 hypothetical protein CLV32_2984 [Pedobacter duraquae]
MEETKAGWADRLFNWFSKDVKTTGLVLLTLSTVYFMRKADQKAIENDVLRDRIIATVTKQVEARTAPAIDEIKRQVDTIKLTSDSSRVDVKNATSGVQKATNIIINHFKTK